VRGHGARQTLAISLCRLCRRFHPRHPHQRRHPLDQQGRHHRGLAQRSYLRAGPHHLRGSIITLRRVLSNRFLHRRKKMGGFAAPQQQGVRQQGYMSPSGGMSQMGGPPAQGGGGGMWQPPPWLTAFQDFMQSYRPNKSSIAPGPPPGPQTTPGTPGPPPLGIGNVQANQGFSYGSPIVNALTAQSPNPSTAGTGQFLPGVPRQAQTNPFAYTGPQITMPPMPDPNAYSLGSQPAQPVLKRGMR
jgi:hypothetical protein